LIDWQSKDKVKANPVEAYYRPIGFQEFESSRSAHEGDKIVNPKPAAFTFQQNPGTNFC